MWVHCGAPGGCANNQGRPVSAGSCALKVQLPQPLSEHHAQLGMPREVGSRCLPLHLLPVHVPRRPYPPAPACRWQLSLPVAAHGARLACRAVPGGQ